MRRLVVVGLVAALLVGAIPVGAITEAQPTRDVSATPKSLGAADDFDSVEFHITVYDNGSAKWTFVYQRTLNNESERQQFRQFAKEFNNNSTKLYSNFKQQARQLASAGQNATGRTMKAEEFSKQAKLDGLASKNRGVVTMSFQWSAFVGATEDSGQPFIGDVFEGGLYIGPNQSLVVHTGSGLKFASASPDGWSPSGDNLASSESITWKGERDFTDRRPRVTFKEVKQETTTTTGDNGSGPSNNTTQDGNASQPPGGDGNGDGGSPLMLFVAAVVLLLGLAAAFAWRQGDFGSLTGGNDNNPGSGGSPGGATATTRRRDESASSEPSVSDEELLTDEARVRKLLDENGGRMKQVNIVDETGWSKSKVSMLLSEMEEEGDISKLRVGRENIISLEGHEPDAAGSPLEDSG
ncbi:helix-turn-helix transcriptional regulator [Halorussus halophilus]|uniref:helix-turn-helix transcriptional regulator n=1 Tax=Halorussus halophilus TaxID=2650975 RepID=UPI001301745B|nr:hypothetical protein [Halorussus halophilus]